MMMVLAVVGNAAYHTIATADGTFDLETNSITNHVLFLKLLVYISTAPSRTIDGSNMAGKRTSNTRFTRRVS